MSPLLALLLSWGPQDSGLREIADAIARGEYERAETLSSEQVARFPQSALAWFYLGHSRAARERFAEAVDPLQKAVRLGLRDPKARFQLGYAAHRAGRHELAVEELSSVLPLLAEPDEARYCLGVSQFDLGSAAAAEATLGPLTEVDGPWKYLSLFHRGLARRRQARETEARADFRAVAEQADAPELRVRARELLDAPTAAAAAEAPRPVSFLALLKAGYDSNVLLLPDTSLSRGSAEGAAFLMSFASAEAALIGDEALTLRADALDLRYDGVPHADLNALLGVLETRQEWKGAGTARLSLHGDLVHQDHEPLFRRAGLSAGFQRDPLPELRLEAGALLMVKDFLPDDVQALDAVEAGARVDLRWKVRPDLAELRTAYAHLQENADADDLDFRTNRGELGMSLYPVAGIETRLNSWLSKADYDGGRHDRRRGLRAAAIWSPSPELQVFAEFEEDYANSTVDAFDYRRHVGSVGASFSY